MSTEEQEPLTESTRPSAAHLSLSGMGFIVGGEAGFIGSHFVQRIGAEGPSALPASDATYLGCLRSLAETRAGVSGLTLPMDDASGGEAICAVTAEVRVSFVINLHSGSRPFPRHA